MTNANKNQEMWHMNIVYQNEWKDIDILIHV
jgi:hypothetical protein